MCHPGFPRRDTPYLRTVQVPLRADVRERSKVVGGIRIQPTASVRESRGNPGCSGQSEGLICAEQLGYRSEVAFRKFSSERSAFPRRNIESWGRTNAQHDLDVSGRKASRWFDDSLTDE